MNLNDLSQRVSQCERDFISFANELRLSFDYIHKDATSSLTKSRIVLERLLCSIEETQGSGVTERAEIGSMLKKFEKNQTIERRILSRMHAIRDMSNLGPHGEHVEPSDAAKVLFELCEILTWYRSRYSAPTFGVNRPQTPQQYECLLPIFVAHPFADDDTEPLRRALLSACEKVNTEQRIAKKPFLCVPQFATKIDHTSPMNELETVRERIRQSALAIFDISQKATVDTFLELGVALGTSRRMVLLSQKPYTSRSEILGLRPIEYSTETELQSQFITLIERRIEELSRPPTSDQPVVHQKMQIAAIWRHRIESATDALYFFARDLSWSASLWDAMQKKIQEGLIVRVCCQKPRETESLKWKNIRQLHDAGVEIRFFDATFDPGLRGFIWEPMRPSKWAAVFVEKEQRKGSQHELRGMGYSIGESEYFYTATIYNTHIQNRMVTAAVRLFESIWERASLPNPPVQVS